MKAVHVQARVSKTGSIELLEPLPMEFRSMDVEVIVHEPAGQSARKYDPWEILAIESFFADDDDADAIYDSL